MEGNRPRRPGVGLAIIIVREGKCLIGQRKGAHGLGTWGFPGGHLEWGESWEDCARREVREEAGIELKNICFAFATNDPMPDDDKHYVTIFMQADGIGIPRVMEPEKCAGWEWHPWDALPGPWFCPIDHAIADGHRPVLSSGKLVRDRIPTIILASGRMPTIHIADQAEYRQRLLEKIVEEAMECRANPSAEELGDLLEVMQATAAEFGFSRAEVDLVRRIKFKERGGFTKRIVLEE